MQAGLSLMDYTKQELEDAQVATLTVAQAREISTGDDDLDVAIDSAQAPVFSGDKKRALVIIEITG